LLDWSTLYRTFRDLWRRYAGANPNPNLGIQVLNHALDPRYALGGVSQEAASLGLNLHPQEDWPLLESLRLSFDELSDSGFDAHNPAASVYQTAIQVIRLRLESALDRENRPRWFYRGQRQDQWLVTPSMFRGFEDLDRQTRLHMMEERLGRLRGCVRALRSKSLGSTDFEAVAIAQHYSAELRISTWLVDVTLSPSVALFFASDGGEPGEVGVVDAIERTEWMSFGGARDTLLGNLRYISPQGIPRIENQKAFFIDAPHPELYEQLSNRRLYFRQLRGVTFEDATLSPPVSRCDIYPTTDTTVHRLPRSWPSAERSSLEWEPPPESIQPLDSSHFYSIAESWMPNPTANQRKLLSAACRLHASMTSRKAQLPSYLITLHHLKRVAHAISEPDVANTVADLIRDWYMPEIEHSKKREAREVFYACLHEAQLDRPSN
jgi:FRG domain